MQLDRQPMQRILSGSHKLHQVVRIDEANCIHPLLKFADVAQCRPKPFAHDSCVVGAKLFA